MFEDLLTKYASIPERVRYAVAFAAMVFLVVIYGALIHAPQQEKLNSLKAEAETLNQKLVDKKIYANNLTPYETRLDDLQQTLNTARRVLPDNPDVPQFLAQLGNSARDVGLNIDRFEPREEKYQDFFAEISFGVIVHGDYNEIALFIDQIGKMDRIVNVSEISMTNPKSNNQRVSLDGAFTVKTYRFLSEEQLAELAAMAKKKKK